jgi:hypothetical protein
MGVHAMGGRHVSGVGYGWKQHADGTLNNEYYLKLSGKANMRMKKYLDWQIPGKHRNKDGPSGKRYWLGGLKGLGASSSFRPGKRGLRKYGAPFFWTNVLTLGPDCYKIKGRGWKNLGGKSSECCNKTYELGEYDAKCFKSSQKDETYLNPDVGLYLDFDVTDYGRPTGCPGFMAYHRAGVWENDAAWRANDRRSMPGGGDKLPKSECPKNEEVADPITQKKMYQLVEDYADDQELWVQDFKVAMEKMIANGYSSSDLSDGPDVFGSKYLCEKEGRRAYTCKGTSD